MRALSLDELIAASSRVVVATVLSNESRWNEEHTRIYTYTTVRVEEYIAGSGTVGDMLVIRTLGGAVGDMSLHIEGAPTFRPTEREVLFLSSITGRSEFSVTGWNQGRFQVRPDPRTGRESVVRPLAGVVFIEPPAGGIAEDFRAIRTVDDLRRAVRRRSRKGE
jgi:hypothetical protein